jgi:hypothetical protein
MDLSWVKVGRQVGSLFQQVSITCKQSVSDNPRANLSVFTLSARQQKDDDKSTRSCRVTDMMRSRMDQYKNGT